MPNIIEENRIRVKVKSTGQVGNVPISKFNPLIFDKLEIANNVIGLKSEKIDNKEITKKPIIQSTELKKPGISDVLKGMPEAVVRVGEFLGFKEAGQEIAEQLFKITKENEQLDKQIQEGSITNEGAEEIKNINTATAKQTIASFANLALTGAGPGLLGGGTKLGLKGVAQATRAGKFKEILKTPGAKIGGFGFSIGASESIRSGETDIKEIAKNGAITAGFSYALPLGMQGVGKIIGTTVKNVSSVLSGVPKDALTFAIDNPQRVSAGINEAIQNPNSMRQIVFHLEQAVKNFKEFRNQNYSKGIEGLFNRNPNIKIKLKNSSNDWLNDIREFGARPKEKSLGLQFVGVDDTESNLLQKAFNSISEESSISLKNAIGNKRRIRTFYRPTAGSTYKAMITSLVHRIDEQIMGSLSSKDQIILNQLNRKYADASEFATLLEKEFRLNINKGNPKNAISSLRRAFKENNEVSSELLEELRQVGGEEAITSLVGHYFKEFFPLGIMGKLFSVLTFGAAPTAGPLIAGTLPLASPRFLGRAATKVIGPAKQLIKKTGEIQEGTIKGGAKTLVPRILDHEETKKLEEE
ncbi:MAG: hypothetical protein AABY22_19550 [Nanoarchaeota archaeon]